MKRTKIIVALMLVLVLSLSVALTGCNNTDDGKSYTYNTYVSTLPSNWNELDSTDSNNDNIMSYIGSAFFEYDYKFENDQKFNKDGSVNADGIIPGAFEVKYSAASGLADVTAEYGKEWGLTDAQIAEGGYIWKITLREDLKWNDGTPIKAEDFVYTMKEQLNPLFKLGRMDSYYNNAVKIKNAKPYVYQGQSGYFAAVELDDYGDNLSSFDGLYFDATNVNAFSSIFGTENMTLLGAYADYGYFNVGDVNVYDELVGYAGENRTPMTQEIADLLAGLFGANGQLGAYWGWADSEIGYFSVAQYTYPTVDFGEVGIFAPSDYDIVLVCDNPMTFFKEDGTLSYLAAYNFSSLPLVKKDLYEACKVAPTGDSTLWTTTYNTTLETTASWGPYMLTDYQEGKGYTLTKNENWYGYGMNDNKGLYQTTAIHGEVIAKEEAAQLAFWSGEVDGLGISVTIAEDYKNSTYAVYSPRIAVFAINICGGLDLLKAHDRNNGVQAIKEFRQALSLSLDRADYNKKLTTANTVCLGYMGEDYYYDVENSGVYRYTEQAKEALLRAYGFTQNDDGTWTDGQKTYATVEDATEVMTGYNLTLAKEKLEEAYAILMADPEYYGYDASKPIQICLGQSDDSEFSNRTYNWVNEWITNLIAGTSFEGKIEVTKDFTLGDAWSDEFVAGNYDICTGGIGNAPFDPYYLIGGWIAQMSSVNFHEYWDPSQDYLTMTMPEGDYAGAGETITLDVNDWYASLNGNMSDGASYNWANIDTDIRLTILGMLEEYGLTQYYSIPTSRGMSASLHAAKWNYVSDEYNTMMGFGGIEYIRYEYDDEAWTNFVASQGGDLREFYKN